MDKLDSLPLGKKEDTKYRDSYRILDLEGETQHLGDVEAAQYYDGTSSKHGHR